MDVVCGRCKAEYEFDDALISGQGTTVRCTSCGLKFKVFPAEAPAVEEWVVTGADGRRRQSFAKLSSLQQAILEAKLQGEDLMRRGEEAPRRLKDIPELQPLLAQQRASLFNTPEEGIPQHPGSLNPPEQQTRLHATPAIVAQQKSTLIGLQSPTMPVPYQQETDEEFSDASDRVAAYGQNYEEISQTDTAERPLGLNSPAVEIPQKPESAKNSSGAISPTIKSPEASKQEFRHKPRLSSSPELARPTPENFGKVPSPQGRPSFTSVEPTPTAMGAYRSASSERVTAIAGLPAPKRAGSRTPLLVLVLGAIAVLVAKYGPLVLQAVQDEQQELKQQKELPVAEAAPGLAAKVQSLEVTFLSLLIRSALVDSKESARALKNDRAAFETRSLTALQSFKAQYALSDLDSKVSQLREKDQTSLIRLLRFSGNWEAAHQQLQRTRKDLSDPFLGPFLDLADPHQEANYSSLIRKFREGAIGEAAPHLLSVAGIYCLVKTEQLARAQVELDKLEIRHRPEEKADAKLFSLLRSLISPKLKSKKDSDSIDTSTPPAKPESPPSSPGQTESEQDEQNAENTPETNQIIKARTITSRADRLWNIGNQKQALTLYRQVLQLVGPQHYLGQRASSRIRRESK